MEDVSLFYDENTAVFAGEDGDKALLELVSKRLWQCQKDADEWYKEAIRYYDMVAGKPWTQEELAELEAKGKSPVSFNRAEVFVQAVCGLEAINRQEVRYIPRKSGSVEAGMVSEMLTSAAQYIGDDCDAEVHHSHAFADMVICGMGWTETRMRFDTNPDGDVEIVRLNPLHCMWDTRARQRNLRDARWVATVFPMSVDEVREQWPDASEQMVYSEVFAPAHFSQSTHDASNAWRYEADPSRRMIRDGDDIWVCQYQWYETESFARVRFADGIKDIPWSQWREITDRVPAYKKLPHAGPVPIRTYKRAFLAGWTVLEVQTLASHDFTLQCMTGKSDHNAGTWYGIMRNLSSPQEWINVLFSEILHIIKTNAKGGVIAERDAVDDPQQFEDTWAAADAVTWVRKGGVSEGKILPKPQAQYPTGLDRLMQYAMGMFTEVTGASLELLGLADKVQPGILEAQRKQAGITILAWAFDALRSYRRRHGRVLADYIRSYLVDERLIRVSTDKGEQYIPLVRDQLSLEYDVIVDESPSSPNEKERVFAVLQQILPMAIQAGYMPPPDLLDYIPLPTSLVERWKSAMSEQQEDPMAQIEIAARKAEIDETRASAEQKQAEAVAAQMKALRGE